MEIKELSEEKKKFYLFLLIHLLVWTGITFIRVVLPADSLEGIWWGSLHDFGSPKHPPLAAWLTYLVYLPFKMDFCVYFMSQLFIILGFIYTYRLAKYFLDENKAMLSVIVLEGCWIYSYITIFYGFNPDVVLMFTLPAMTFYFYNCMYKNNPSDWIKLGVLTGLSCLNKYQTILLVAGMFIWAVIFNRKVFKNKFFYISAMLAFLIFLPHILWLIKYDFFPLLYYNRELNIINGYNHITSPLMFIGMQFVMIIGTLTIYTFYRLVNDRKFVFIKNYDKKDFWFLLIVPLTSFCIHVLIGLYYGSDIRPRWGYVFWYMLGIMLFYFLPTRIGKKEFDFILRTSYSVMLIVFISLSTLFIVEKNYRSRYPVNHVWNDMKTIWAKQVDAPLIYIGGDSEWTFPLSIYGDTHPINVMDTFGYKNPWVNEDNLKKHGLMLIDRRGGPLLKDVITTCQYLPENYKLKFYEYKFFVRNALNQSKEYTIFYTIIPPMK